MDKEHNLQTPNIKDSSRKHNNVLTWVLSIVTVASLASVVVLTILLVNSWNQVKVTTKTETPSKNTVAAGTCFGDKVNTLPNGYAWYSDMVLGFKFAYPASWGDVKISTTAVHGETGKYLSGTFSNKKDVWFGGNAVAYTVGARGGMLTDNPGYLQAGNRFYTVQFWDSSDPNAPTTHSINMIEDNPTLNDGCNAKALVSQSPFVEFFGFSYDLARFNLQSTNDFYGVNFVVKNPDAGLRSEFNNLIGTFELIK